jgi:hypothetical protein
MGMNVNTVKMRFIDFLCPPAMLYLIFVTIQVALDVSLGHLMTAGVKTIGGIIGVIVLDALCGIDLGIVSWFIVAIPFVVTSLATAIALGLDLDRRATTKVKETFAQSPLASMKKSDGVPTADKKETFGLASEVLSSPGGKLANVREAVDYPFSSNAPF